MKVRANAETPLDAETARKFGAEGIGLCRTEHMFFDPERIGAVRQMIMARDEAGRRAALAKLLPFQRDDFLELFRIMAGLPVTIRLLDPPLHEFLPHADAELAEVARGARHRCRGDAPARGGAGRGQPDAGPSRLPAGHHLSRDLRDAGARDLRGRRRGGEGNRQGADPGDHDPAGRHARRSWRSPARRSTRWRRRCSPRPARRSSTPSAR